MTGVSLILGFSVSNRLFLVLITGNTCITHNRNRKSQNNRLYYFNNDIKYTEKKPNMYIGIESSLSKKFLVNF